MWSGNEQSIQQVVRDKSSNSSLSEIRSILDCQANLFSVFLCLPRATAFTSWFVYSPKVYWSAQTADSYDICAALRRPREETRAKPGCVFKYQFTNDKSRCTKDQEEPSSSQYHNLPPDPSHSSQVPRLCVFDFFLVGSCRNVNIAVPKPCRPSLRRLSDMQFLILSLLVSSSDL